MSCEAAAQLILSQTDKMQLVALAEAEEALWEEETQFITMRSRIFATLQDRTKTVDSRIEAVLDYCGIKEDVKTAKQWAQIYRRLERLDTVWDTVLDGIEDAKEYQLTVQSEEWLETAFEQLICYFIYRHLADSLDDGRFSARLMFAVQSCRMIKWTAALHYNKYGNIDVKTLAEIARIYSTEVEYSTENIEALLDVFEQ